MAADPAHDSDRLLNEAGASLARQRAGGRRAAGDSIGRGSAELKARHRAAKIKRIVVAVAAIVLAAMAAGLVIDGLGFAGLFMAFLAVVAAVVVLANFPRLEVPSRAKLNTGSVSQMVARTELWLEAQRPALPTPAAQLVGHIGGQLDALGVQLAGLDDREPAAVEVRRLIGEHLPEMVSSYTAIPRHLRSETRGGATPDAQLIDGLSRISAEIDEVTRKLAEGALDDLAVRSRYLDYRYGGEVQALPDAALRDATLGAPGARTTELPDASADPSSETPLPKPADTAGSLPKE